MHLRMCVCMWELTPPTTTTSSSSDVPPRCCFNLCFSLMSCLKHHMKEYLDVMDAVGGGTYIRVLPYRWRVVSTIPPPPPPLQQVHESTGHCQCCCASNPFFASVAASPPAFCSLLLLLFFVGILLASCTRHPSPPLVSPPVFHLLRRRHASFPASFLSWVCVRYVSVCATDTVPILVSDADGIS